MPLVTERQRIQHLLRRAGFGYSAAELERYGRLGLEGTVDHLLHPEVVDDSHVDATIKSSLKRDPMEHRPSLIARWHLRLVHTERPLLEKLTYFWHDHFATSLSKVRPHLLLQQNETLRANALGSFQDLLLSITRDPAMLVWLDNRANQKNAPNENYAREVMELYTLGRGKDYTETDIKEAARAFTGWRVDDANMENMSQFARAVFTPKRHDGGVKTVLGVTGRLDDAGVIGILAEHPDTPGYVGAKLWRFFAVPEPTPEMIARTTRAYFEHNGSIRAMVRTILLSDEMYSPQAYRWRIKSPVELIVGAERALGARTIGYGEIENSRAMGQVLFEPPNPAGWPGGATWVNSTTLLARANFAHHLTQAGKGRAFGVDVPGLLAASGVQRAGLAGANALVDYLLDLLVGGDVDAMTRDVLLQHLGAPYHYSFEQAAKSGTLNGVVYLVLGMPLYQLA